MRAYPSKNEVFDRGANTLLITGDGSCLKNDVAKFQEWRVTHDVMAIGRSIQIMDASRHWVNADGETAIAWAKQIKAKNPEITTHTLGPVDGFDVDWTLEQDDYNYQKITNEAGRMHGSSSLLAACIGIYMGYDKIVLAGCPMDFGGHWYYQHYEKPQESLGPIWLGMDFAAWIDFAAHNYQVSSMSGYTAKLLGWADSDDF